MSQASIQERTAHEESELLDRLRAGDERAFEELVTRFYPTMLAVAQHHVRTRTVPYSSLGGQGGDPEEPAVEPERFRGAQDPFPGHWRAYPGDWHRLPDEALTERETLKVVIGAIEALPPAQKMVIALRDIQGCEPEEVCSLLDVSEGNQRVLLHRARSKVRAALERHLDG